MKKEKLKWKKSNWQWSMKIPMFLEKTDKRYKKYKKQIKEQGFCDSETWGLNTTIAAFIVPRLKRFKEINGGFPICFEKHEEWNNVLDKIIFAFEWHLKQDESIISESERKIELIKYDEGMKLFVEYFQALWW